MSYRTILVHCGHDEAAGAVIAAAAAMAARFDAMLIGVGALAWAPLLDLALVAASPGTVGALHEAHVARMAAAEARFRAVCARHSGASEWRSVAAFPNQAVIDLARCADLIVAGSGPPDGDDRARPDPADLVMRAGLPVLLVPRKMEDHQPRNVLVGWKNTRESRRAIGASLPLLKIAEKVVLAHMCTDPEAPAAWNELESVAARLRRHGVRTRSVTYPRLGAEADEDLLALAYGYGADTIVAGAHGHSELREWAFGGVTHNLLRQCERRVLLG